MDEFPVGGDEMLDVFNSIAGNLAAFGVTTHERDAIRENIRAAARAFLPLNNCSPITFCWLVTYLTLSLLGEVYRPNLFQDLAHLAGGTFRRRFTQSPGRGEIPIYTRLYKFIQHHSRDREFPGGKLPALTHQHLGQRVDFKPLLQALGFSDPFQVEILCKPTRACFDQLRIIPHKDERGREVKGLPTRQLVPTSLYYVLTRLGSKVPGIRRSQAVISATCAVTETTVRAGWKVARTLLEHQPGMKKKLDDATRLCCNADVSPGEITSAPLISALPTRLVDRFGEIRYEGHFYKLGTRHRGSRVILRDGGAAIEVFDAAMTHLADLPKQGWLSNTRRVDVHGRLYCYGRIFRLPRLAGTDVRVVFLGNSTTTLSVLSKTGEVLARLDPATGKIFYT